MEPDSLTALEERIRRAVDLVSELRQQKEAALRAAAETEPLRQRIAELTRELETARAERDTLKTERETVRRRVEKLLEQIDTLNAG